MKTVPEPALTLLPPAPARRFEPDLEALRGVAAWLVVWFHLMVHQYLLDPGYIPPGAWSYAAPGHVRVLLFFVLSGYVIGLRQRDFAAPGAIAQYLKRRLLRLYPIYFVVLLLALAVAGQAYPAGTVAAHFTLTQVALAPVMAEVVAIWSLHYETLYYLLFVPLALLRLRPGWALVGALALGTVNTMLYPALGPPLLTSYAYGLVFWLAGLAVARYLPPAEGPPNYARMVGFLLLTMCVPTFDVPWMLATKVQTALGLSPAFPADTPLYEQIITFVHLAWLPYCVLALVSFAHRRLPYARLWVAALVLLPLLKVLVFLRAGQALTSAKLLTPSLLYLAALLVFALPGPLDRLCRALIGRARALGGTAYAVYLVHLPLLHLFPKVTVWAGSPGTYLLRLAAYVALVAGVSYLLERRYQPWTRRHLGRWLGVPVAGR